MDNQVTRIMGHATAFSTMSADEVSQVSGGLNWAPTFNESLSNPSPHGSGEVQFEMDDCAS